MLAPLATLAATTASALTLVASCPQTLR
jgi:hypothetical protein